MERASERAQKLINAVVDEYSARKTAIEDDGFGDIITSATVRVGNEYLDCTIRGSKSTPYTPLLVFRWHGKRIYACRGAKTEGNISDLEKILQTATSQAVANPYYF